MKKNIRRTSAPVHDCSAPGVRLQRRDRSSGFVLFLFFFTSNFQKRQDDCGVCVVRVRQVEAGKEEMKARDEVLPSQT